MRKNNQRLWPKPLCERPCIGDYVRCRIRTSLDAGKLGIISHELNDDLVVVYWIHGARKNLNSHEIDTEEYHVDLLEKVDESKLDQALNDLNPSDHS